MRYPASPANARMNWQADLPARRERESDDRNDEPPPIHPRLVQHRPDDGEQDTDNGERDAAHTALDPRPLLDPRIPCGDNEDEEGGDGDRDQREGRAEVAVRQVAKADHPETGRAGAHLADDDRVPEIRIRRPMATGQVLMQARQVAQPAGGEERRLQEEEEVEKGINHGCATCFSSTIGGAGRRVKKSAPRPIAARMTTITESLRKMTASAHATISTQLASSANVPSS